MVLGQKLFLSFAHSSCNTNNWRTTWTVGNRACKHGMQETHVQYDDDNATIPC